MAEPAELAEPLQPASVSALMEEATGGSHLAADQLMEMFYPELKRLASGYMQRERPEHTWQPTALVHELYLELLKVRALRTIPDNGHPAKAQFFGLAAQLMRRLLIHHARPLAHRVGKAELPVSMEKDDPGFTLVEIESLLARLGRVDPQCRCVVELKVFHGMSMDEISEYLGCAPRTAARHWTFARTWLQRNLQLPAD